MLSESVVILDFETTGLRADWDRITEVAALRFDGRRVTDSLVTLVNSGVPISEFITSLTGITNQMIAGAPPTKTVVKELVEFIGSSTVVAHNANFDQKFLLAESRRAGVAQRSYKMLCTLRLTRRLVPGLRSYSLSSVAKSLEVTYQGQAHRAEADARVTVNVLGRLVTNISEHHRVPAVDPALLCRVSAWSVRSAPDKLARVLSAESRERTRRQAIERCDAVNAASPVVSPRVGETSRTTPKSSRPDSKTPARVEARMLNDDTPYTRSQLSSSTFERTASPSRHMSPLGKVEAPPLVRPKLRKSFGRLRPWVLDTATGDLIHRESRRRFSQVQYLRTTGYISGYTIRDREHPWASDLEIDIE